MQIAADMGNLFPFHWDDVFHYRVQWRLIKSNYRLLTGMQIAYSDL
jgi:hypothetical protein